jgi:NAD(P)-dependent dehydrogenase (short-subunit alcohol dehydrogenase family)
VTGGGRGIGRAIALALAAGGADVAIGGRGLEALEAVAGELRALGRRALPARCDVADGASVSAFAARVRQELGAPTIVVCNSGIGRSAKFADTDEASWNEVINVNLTGTYRTIHAFATDLLAAGPKGRVIAVASVAARVGFPYTAAYAASKHGILGLIRTLALEWGSRGPTVNCVCPGWTDTDMAGAAAANIAAKTGKDGRAALEAQSPQRRLVEVEEVAAVCRYLASDLARAINGQGINVDGGQVMS